MSKDGTHDVDERSRRWRGLIALLAGVFLPPLDFFIVNVALPSIRQDFDASASVMQLVVSAYATMYAVMLITGGRLGDIFGRRNTFLVGMGLFAVASILCGCAWSATSLVVARALQGLSAAIMAPQALASINALFPESEKAKALSLYSLTFGLASTAGLFLGGTLIDLDLFGLRWRTIFFINVPVIALAMPAGWYLVQETKSDLPKQLDVGGAVLIALALFALIMPLIEGRDRGWPVWSFVLLVGVCPLGILLWRHESRLEQAGRDPIFPPSLLRVSGVLQGLFAALMFYALAAFWLVFTVYQQNGLNRSPFEAGLSVLPAAAGFIVGPFVNPWIAGRFGKHAAATGMLLQVAGLLGTSAIVWVSQAQYLALPLFMIGMGQGIALPNLIGNIVGLVDQRRSGLASGLVSSMFQISGALAVAVIGGLFFALQGEASNSRSTALAYAVSAIAIAACLLISALYSSTLPRRRNT